MRKSLLVLLLAVLCPSLLLGWLALRSAREQEIVLERRTAELYQRVTESVATAARSLVSEQRREFAEALRQMLAEEPAAQLGPRFTEMLAQRWKQPAIGFVLDREGRLLSPTAADAAARPEWRRFLLENSAFLGNKMAATVYPVQMEELNRPDLAARRQQQGFFPESKSSAAKAVSPNAAPASKNAPGGVGDQLKKERSPQDAEGTQLFRNVAPQRQAETLESQLTWSTAEFRELTMEGEEGVVNRFVQDRLNMIFWVRPPAAREYLFGCLLRADDLKPHWSGVFPPAEPTSRRAPEPDYTLALLDDQARPAAVSPGGEAARNWKQPFVASEIGEALPHWEAALYLRHPERLQASARTLRYTLYITIGCALLAIAAGGWVVYADTQRQLALAQKKTDFVSNVSHELKTPLTSIRMFAELMHSGRADSSRQPQYLRIIMVEAERLTRLINNVLDFARLERRQRRFEMRPLDLHAMLEEVWPGQELHLREAGFTTHWEAAPPPYRVVGDKDALAQVLVNLLSNAEKYGAERKEIALHSYLEEAWVCVNVLDRGGGVPAGETKKIFEPFYRAHDSLSSGIPGSGLGLALAQRVVREHGGEILYQARPGGGSNFTLRLPRVREPDETEMAS